MLRIVVTGFLLIACSCHTEGSAPPLPAPLAVDESAPTNQAPVPERPGATVSTKPSSNARRGSITYISNNSVFRLDVRSGAKPINLSEQLDKKAPGKDEYVAVSRNGKFIALSTTRFLRSCADWACLTLLNADLSMTATILVKGSPIRPAGKASVSNDGKIVVYASDEGPHAMDIFAVRQGRRRRWGKPSLLTAASTHNYNASPTLSPDGSKLLFDCGPVPYAQAGTGVCEVRVDGSDLTRLVDPNDNPVGTDGEFLACHGDYMKDGGILFEADWSGEQLWMAKNSSKPQRVNPALANDNAPCLLPGGYVASLWLERPGSSGLSEIKIMQTDGTKFSVLTPNVSASQINCHQTVSPPARERPEP